MGDELDGLLAGSEQAKEAISQAPKAVADQIEKVAASAFTFALANATWVLVGIGALCTVLTWWLVEPRQRTSELPEAAQTPEHHHRFSGFHL